MTTSSADLGGLNLPELTALMHSVADEIELRMMQQAGENVCVCCVTGCAGRAAGLPGMFRGIRRELRREENMRKYWKVLALLAVVVAAMTLLAGCGAGGDKKPEKMINAKIRYFDGVSEMVELRGYEILNGFARLDTAAGDRIYVGANNVNIIEEEVNR